MAKSLLQTVVDLDASVFGAFNDRDLDRFTEFFADDLEFYHDQDGRSGYAELAGSIEVHAVPGHGAIQIGQHEFCHEEDGTDDCGIVGFTHVWHRTSDGWKITRVLSYGH